MAHSRHIIPSRRLCPARRGRTLAIVLVVGGFGQAVDWEAGLLRLEATPARLLPLRDHQTHRGNAPLAFLENRNAGEKQVELYGGLIWPGGSFDLH